MNAPAARLSARRSQRLSRSARQDRRRLALETLEHRHLMAQLPFGAMPDDTAEYMLGEVYVTVVLMESDPTLSPRDVNREDWTPGEITNVKAKVQEGVSWWKETLANEFPNVPADSLNFTFDFTYADDPVETGYEPINRPSDDFQSWMYSFLNKPDVKAGINITGSYSTDIRAFNNKQRVNHGAHWAFTIFVVDDSNDSDHMFASQGTFDQAFAFAGGRFLISPASRPASTFAHETGHIFWAMDEYAGIANAQNTRRGYYNVVNGNAARPGYTQLPSIMSNDVSLATAYSTHTSDDFTLAHVGWRDSDLDGIMDVLDVPLSLDGSGWFDDSDGTYKFLGKSSVRTLPNQNSEGLQNDITLNRVRAAQYSLDGGAWTTAGTYDDTTVDLQLSFPVTPTVQEVRIRTIDTKTGVTSREYTASQLETPSVVSEGSVQGLAWWDSDFDGLYDPEELPAFDMPVWIVDQNGQQVALKRSIDPEDYADKAPLDIVNNEATLSAVAYNSTAPPLTGEVISITSASAPIAGKVFGSVSLDLPGYTYDTWNLDSRALKVKLSTPVTTVSIRAWAAGVGGWGRIEAHNSAGDVVARYTTELLTGSDTEVMTVARAEGDIDYITVGGAFGKYIALDDLTWGPDTNATTDGRGAYAISNLPAGNYHIKLPLGSFRFTTTPIGGVGNFGAVASAAQTVMFGIGQLPNPWHNSAVGRSFDVNDSGSPDINDILISVYHYSLYPNASLPTNGPAPGAKSFVDVDNTGTMTIDDILQVIYAYTRARGGAVGESVNSPSADGGATTNSGGNVTPSGSNAGPNGEHAEDVLPIIASDAIEHCHDHGDEHAEHALVDGVADETAAALALSGAPPATERTRERRASAKTADACGPGSAGTDAASQDDALLSLLDEPLI